MALCRSIAAGEAWLATPSSCLRHSFDDKTRDCGGAAASQLSLSCDARLTPSASQLSLAAATSSSSGNAPGHWSCCLRARSDAGAFLSRRQGGGANGLPLLSVASGSTSSWHPAAACVEARYPAGGEVLRWAPLCGSRRGKWSSSCGLPAGVSRYERARGYWMAARALGGTGTDRVEDTKTGKAGLQDMRDVGDMQALESGDWNVRPMVTVVDEADPSWEQINMVFRVVYAAVMYGGLAFAGNVLCNFLGLDCWGGFQWDVEVALTGLGYAMPPMVLLLVILEDEVVKICSAARAIRDVEDNEIMDFFAGMSSWQFAFVVAAGALSEELFFRVAIQGGLAHALKVTGSGGVDETVHGVAALTGFIPLFVPFAQGLAAFLTASLIGSMYYIISSPKDPKYIIAHSNQGRRDLKKRVEVWHERRQLRKIYSPLMEALLALYLGLEWIQTGNIMATMITHCLYSTVVVGTGLRRIHEQRKKLRERVKDVVDQRRSRAPVLQRGDVEETGESLWR